MTPAPLQALVVLSTVSSLDEGRRIASELVNLRLAACVNLVPQIESIYRWQGAVESAQETLLVIKTTAARFPELRDKLIELHAYDVPEVVALTVVEGSPSYLQWLSESV